MVFNKSQDVFKGKRMAILGFGIEGKDAVRFLVGQGAQVVIFDKKSKEELELGEVGIEKWELRSGENYLEGGLDGFDYIVRSPGVRPDLPQISEAKKNGVKVTSAINIFFSLCPCPTVGVTGTKGKGTTATLIKECLVNSGKFVYLAGNIGIPYLELLPKLAQSDVVILELSSFQLIDIEYSPHIAAVLNITADHLDWHKNENEYLTAKENIVRFQNKNDFAVITKDYKTPASFSKKTEAKVYWTSIKEEVKGGYVVDGKIFLNVDKALEVGRVGDLQLLGKHNWENVASAVCASYLAGATVKGIKKGVFSFTGLPHRLEKVATINGITFYNDSFATSPAPTLAAVNAFEKPVILILGGSGKNLSYGEMARDLSKKTNLKAVLVIGEVGQEIENELTAAGYRGKIIKGGRDMSQIIKNAVSVSESGDVVLLSPSAASFDMFLDYKDRGDQFRNAALNLKN